MPRGRRAWRLRARRWRKTGSLARALSADLCGGAIVRTLVVGPADLEVVALGAALEAELHIRIFRDRRAPIGEEHRLAVVLEGKLLDEMRRDDLSLRVLDEAGIHRMLDQRLHLGGVAVGGGAHANGRCHVGFPLRYLRMILSENRFPLFRIMR